MPFRVIHGFWYQSKAHMRLSIVTYTISCTGSENIAFDMSKIMVARKQSLYIGLSTPLAFNLSPQTEGFSWEDLRKIFLCGQRMAKVPNGVET